MDLRLTALLGITNATDYKVHLASWNQKEHPLTVFLRDRSEWDGWNSWRSGRDDFNRRYILSLIELYDKPSAWLFGGVYEVVGRRSDNHAASYDIERCPEHESVVGRLQVQFTRPGRAKALCLEEYQDELIVSSLLAEPYAGEPFPGHDNINHELSTLRSVYREQRPDWKSALATAKGVYVVIDKSDGRKYVASASGEYGLWARWGSYVSTGHAGNDGLTELIAERGEAHALENFRLVLLEYFPARTDDAHVLRREAFWKEALMTRKFGYNRN